LKILSGKRQLTLREKQMHTGIMRNGRVLVMGKTKPASVRYYRSVAATCPVPMGKARKRAMLHLGLADIGVAIPMGAVRWS
jgi:hypothetical protein